MTPGYYWHDFIGNVGVAAIIVSYLLMQLGRLDARGLSYAAVNAAGAGLVLVSLTIEFNLSAFIVELFWALISLFGIVRVVGERRRSTRNDVPQPGQR